MKDTPWGKLPIFDAHAHFFSRAFVQKLGAMAGIAGAPTEVAAQTCARLKWTLPPEDPAELGRQWLAELDRHGVDRSAMFHTLPGDVESLAAALRTVNAPGTTSAAGTSPRLVGYAMLNPVEPGALERVRPAFESHDFRGLLLFPAMHRYDVNDPALDELFRFADERSLAVFVHCGVLKVGFRTALGLPCPFDMSKGNPLALQKRAAECPRASFIIPHLGSGLLRELLMLADVCPNVYTDTSGIPGWTRCLPQPPGAPGDMSSEDCLKRVLDVMGPRRVLFGSDSTFFPRGWRSEVFTQFVEIMQRAGVNAEEAGMMLGGNLGRILDSTSR